MPIIEPLCLTETAEFFNFCHSRRAVAHNLTKKSYLTPVAKNKKIQIPPLLRLIIYITFYCGNPISKVGKYFGPPSHLRIKYNSISFW